MAQSLDMKHPPPLRKKKNYDRNTTMNLHRQESHQLQEIDFFPALKKFQTLVSYLFRKICVPFKRITCICSICSLRFSKFPSHQISHGAKDASGSSTSGRHPGRWRFTQEGACWCWKIPHMRLWEFAKGKKNENVNLFVASGLKKRISDTNHS